MSNVDVSKYAEVANEAENILQEIMGNPSSGPVARAIAASALLQHCESIVRREHFNAMAKSKKRPTDLPLSVNVNIQKTTDVDPDIIYNNVRRFSMNVEEAMKLGRVMY